MNSSSPHSNGQWIGTGQTLTTICREFGGELLGKDISIKGVAGLSNAGVCDLTFAQESADEASILSTKAAAITAHPKWSSLLQKHKLSAIITSNPYPFFARVASYFYQQPAPARDERHLASLQSTIKSNIIVGAFTTIGVDVEIGDNCCIGSNVSIGDRVKIGHDVWIYPNVSIYPDTVIGNGVMIHSGTVIGADGFGFQPEMVEGIRKWQKVPQMAKVIIGDEVELGANCCIDRGAQNDTIIGNQCKFDNLVHIAHGCRIGERNLFMPQSCMGGSVTMQNDCLVGGQSGILPNINITSGVSIHPKASAFKDINQAGEYSGTWPLQKHRAWLRTQARLKKR